MSSSASTTTIQKENGAEGILIGQHSRLKWKIGRCLGSGACGAVHEVVPPRESSSDKDRFVVKVAPLPPPALAKKTRKKKKKKTEVERNADLLYYESTMYTAKLSHLRGSVIGDVPLSVDGLSCYGEAQGFAYLAMERMEAPLEHVVSLLQRQAKEKSSRRVVSLGGVAKAMLDIVEAVHRQYLLVVDIKMDNFMLARGVGGDEVASRIRLIDLALLESFHDLSTGKHRIDAFPGAPVCGTPTYASIAVLQGHTVSRRDDLEALGFVFWELALLASTTGKALPWAHATSDENVLRLKLESVVTHLPSPAGETLQEYFDHVRQLKYSAKPDYNRLRDMLQRFDVPLSPATTTTTTTTTRTTTTKEPEVEDDDETKENHDVDQVRSNRRKDGDEGRRLSGTKRPTTTMTTRTTTAPESKRRRSKDPPLNTCQVEDEDDDKENGAETKRKDHHHHVAKDGDGRMVGRKRQMTTACTVANIDDNDDDEDDDSVEFDEDVPPTDRAKRRRRRAAVAAAAAAAAADGEEQRRRQRRVAAAAAVSSWNEEEQIVASTTTMEASCNAASFSNRQETRKPRHAVDHGPNDVAALFLKFLEGSQQGQVIPLGLDFPNSYCIGTAPFAEESRRRRRGGASRFVIANDDDETGSVADLHVKVVLQVGKLYSVEVTQLSPTCLSFVNGKPLTTKKKKRAFVGDKLRLGTSCVLQIVKG